MSKLVKLTDPKEIAAAKEYLALGKNLKEHIAFLHKQYQQDLLDASIAFNKKFRDLFIRASHKHLPDAESAYAEKTHLILNNDFDPDSPVYLMARPEWESYMEPPPPEPVDHSALLEDKVVH